MLKVVLNTITLIDLNQYYIFQCVLPWDLDKICPGVDSSTSEKVTIEKTYGLGPIIHLYVFMLDLVQNQV